MLLAKARRSLDILYLKKEARLAARALAEEEVGTGETDLRLNSLLIVCQKRRRLLED